MNILPFQKDDKEIFLRLCEEFYSSHATIRPFNGAVAEKTFKRVIAKHENLWGYLMFDKNTDEPVGYSLITSYWCNEEGGNILVLDELYIRPTERHKGYATTFMEWLDENFKDRAVSITLEVLTTNIDAIKVYKKEGFSPDGFTTYTKQI